MTYDRPSAKIAGGEFSGRDMSGDETKRKNIRTVIVLFLIAFGFYGAYIVSTLLGN